ncbi:protein SCAI-like protein [Leptotrombidium deliense]|uniref:Protein SCAI-like protein n=1 Tax=Leptotrombidium deliense TaxID=299467 RepID=A0A443SM70_9ACAR|nr:protein SCAI-like protein [Leptotrombidium deliense]
MQKNRISAVNRLENCYDSRGSLDDITAQTHHQQRRIVVMSEIEEQERKIVNEFCHLLEKSKQLFNGLRDLPQYGHKQWQPYFGRTFDVYTKLWKYQQQHRPVLDAKYGLKRWQIGEIASKIGQLYYHYYLRTSETNYLNEAYSFYAAIRGRGYYSKANKEERSDLMVKKLRYYARFIVVCLLLKKMKLVRDLVRELSKHIDDYTATYEPDDQMEWSLVLSEIKSFIESDNLITVIDVDNVPLVISHRLNPLNTPPLEKIPTSHLTLQEILIVGNVCDQVKFSELTLDMFRMLQALEREPQEDINQLFDTSPALGRMTTFPENGDHRSLKRENPHKYLLYRPTFSQLFVFLASGFKELPPTGVLLLYLSADGAFPNVKHPEDYAYDFGGVITNTKRETDHSNKRILHFKDMHCLYPGDLYPFLRKPFFLIVDSDNSSAFQHIPRYFGQPFLILMSPEEAPPPFHEQQNKGSLFTLFLHSPLTAICLISNIIEIPLQLWEKAQSHIDRFLAEAGRLLVRSRSIDPVYIQFYGDDFLRLLILRFIFCCVVIRMHRLFRNRNYIPRCHPLIPENEIFEHPSLRRAILDMAVTLDIRSMFADLEEAD